MTSSHNPKRQIAWPEIDNKVQRYFRMVGVLDKGGNVVLPALGSPSPVSNYEMIRGENLEYVTPAWLIQRCDVGCALSSLTDEQWCAVVVRWLALIAQEDFERDQTVCQSARINRRKRGGGDGDLRRRENKARARWEEAQRVRRRAERRMAYSAGMGVLAKILEQ